MLEANVYDNFNPNYYNISDFTLPNGKKDKRGLPIPKARCQVINYELWETGYLYTSSAFSFYLELPQLEQLQEKVFEQYRQLLPKRSM